MNNQDAPMQRHDRDFGREVTSTTRDRHWTSTADAIAQPLLEAVQGLGASIDRTTKLVADAAGKPPHPTITEAIENIFSPPAEADQETENDETDWPRPLTTRKLLFGTEESK